MCKNVKKCNCTSHTLNNATHTHILKCFSHAYCIIAIIAQRLWGYQEGFSLNLAGIRQHHFLLALPTVSTNSSQSQASIVACRYGLVSLNLSVVGLVCGTVRWDLEFGKTQITTKSELSRHENKIKTKPSTQQGKFSFHSYGPYCHTTIYCRGFD